MTLFVSLMPRLAPARPGEGGKLAEPWSMGCVIYEMLSGKAAFARKSGADTLAAILSEKPQSIREIEPSVPVELQRIIIRMLEKKRTERYQTVKELLTDLRAFKQEREFNQLLKSRS